MSPDTTEHEYVLKVRDLTVDIRLGSSESRVVDGVSIEVHAGETVGLVGESGSGKSMFARTVVRLPPPNLEMRTNGAIEVAGYDIYELGVAELMKSRRAGTVGLIFQDPVASLNPTMRVGEQVREALQSSTAAQFTVEGLLERVGLHPAVSRRYPHELSGGQRQRIVIAIALAGNPRLLIADEATTALDPQVQRAIVDLLEDLKNDNNAGLLMISHDLEMIAQTCSRIYVMHNGQIVETNRAKELFESPEHWYTKKLIGASQRLAFGVGEG